MKGQIPRLALWGRRSGKSGGDSKECSEEPECPPSWEATADSVEDGILESGSREEAPARIMVVWVLSNCSEPGHLKSLWMGQPGWGMDEANPKAWEPTLLHKPPLSPLLSVSHKPLNGPSPPTSSQLGSRDPWLLQWSYHESPCFSSLPLQSVPHTTAKHHLSKMQAWSCLQA